MQALTVYQRMADPVAAIKFLGEAIAKSRLFKCENEAQGHVLAAECLTRGMSPLTLEGRHHLVGGSKLTKKAHVILADFQKFGGTFRLLARTADEASIGLSLGENKIVESLTWEEAQQEAWPWSVDKKTGKKTLKDNWATPRARRQMLWARVISEGVRSICPQAAEGYAPEEFGAIDDSDAMDAVVDEVSAGDFPTTTTPATDATFEPKATAAVTTNDTPPFDPSSASTSTPTPRDLLVREIERLFGTLGLDDAAQSRVLAKRNVQAIRQLADDQMEELRRNLEAKLEQRPATPTTTPERESRLPIDARTVPVDGPATEPQIEEIKRIVREWELSKPGVSKDFRQRLEGAGKKLKDFTTSEAQALIQALGVKNIEAFFAQSLEKKTA